MSELNEEYFKIILHKNQVILYGKLLWLKYNKYKQCKHIPNVGKANGQHG